MHPRASARRRLEGRPVIGIDSGMLRQAAGAVEGATATGAEPRIELRNSTRVPQEIRAPLRCAPDPAWRNLLKEDDAKTKRGGTRRSRAAPGLCVVVDVCA